MKWNIYMLGKLGDRPFINSIEALQFNVSLISEESYGFPENKIFTGYASCIEQSGFVDDRGEADELRKQELVDFFENRLLIFKPFSKKGNYKDKENYSIDDVITVKKPEAFNDEYTYKAVPVFRKKSLNISFEKFKEKLLTKQWFDKIDGISEEVEDTPSIIFFDDEEKIIAIVGVNGQTFRGGQVRYDFDKLYFIDEKEHWYNNFIRSPELEEIIFVENNTYLEIEKSSELINEINIENINDLRVEKKINLERTLDVEMYEENYNINEKSFIDKFVSTVKNMDLIYKYEDLINFHTAMKSSNLVILSGMSGTGKSKIVQAYGRALGIKEENLNFIPVRPSWADDSDLLGYVDTMHNVYRPGDSRFLDTIISASINKNEMYIVCLDEMNLARVEHYFSQFLSVLELDEDSRILNLYNSDLEKKLYNSEKYPADINIGENILFVGTVNLDESTYHFSDKVLDRSNVIVLNQSDFLELKNLYKHTQYDLKCHEVSFLEYKKMMKDSKSIDLTKRELEMLSEIHQSMNFFNKNIGIGFRIIRQIDKYIKNIPSNSTLTRSNGVDLQLVQRVLTKVRGTQEQWKDFIGEYDIYKKEVINSSIIEILDKYNDISDFKISKKYVFDKARELNIYGYTL